MDFRRYFGGKPNGTPSVSLETQSAKRAVGTDEAQPPAKRTCLDEPIAESHVQVVAPSMLVDDDCAPATFEMKAALNSQSTDATEDKTEARSKEPPSLEIGPADRLIPKSEFKVREIESGHDGDENQKRVFALYSRHFDVSETRKADTIKEYLRDKQRCRTWILVCNRPGLLAAATIRLNPFVYKNGHAWAQVLYVASLMPRCGYGKALFAGLEELLWEERVEMYCLYSLRTAVPFWTAIGMQAIGMQAGRQLLPDEELRDNSKARLYRPLTRQSDREGMLPHFGKILVRPYAHPPLIPLTDVVEVVDGQGRTRTVSVAEEKSWKKLIPRVWPGWRLSQRSDSFIEAIDLLPRIGQLVPRRRIQGTDSFETPWQRLSCPSRTGASSQYASSSSSLIRRPARDMQELQESAIKAGLRGKNVGDPAVVLTRSTRKYMVFMPAALISETVLVGPFEFKVHRNRFSEWFIVWEPGREQNCTALLWSTQNSSLTAQMRLTVNGHERILENACKCTWNDSEAVGFEFPKPSDGFLIRVDLMQTSMGPVNSASSAAEPPSLQSLQGLWQNSKGFLFTVTGYKVTCESKVTKTFQDFGMLEYAASRHGWLRLHDYVMQSKETTKRCLHWKNQEGVHLVWTRPKAESASRSISSK